MKFIILIAAMFMPVVLLAQEQPAPSKRSAGTGEKPAIVLIHGSFADGSSWQEVIPILQRSGYKTAAAQMPLTSFAEDVAFAKRLIEGQKGEVIVVGHSYGGAVISEAAFNNPNVKALVYLAAFALDNGESANDLTGKFKSTLGDALVPDAAGFLYIDPAKFHDIFAQDLPKHRTDMLAAVQKPIFKAAFSATGKNPAWKTIPTWYMVTSEDHTVSPELQRFLAKRMGAHTAELKASHAAMLSKAKNVAKFIEDAVKEETALAAPK